MAVPSILIVTLALALAACSNSDFAGGGKKKANDSSSGKKADDGADDGEIAEDGQTDVTTGDDGNGEVDDEQTATDTDAGTDESDTNADDGDLGEEEETSCKPGEGIIDFEQTGAAASVEGTKITDQFKEKFGVEFSLEGGGDAKLAKFNTSSTSHYTCNAGDCSQANNGLRPTETRVGQFFLASDTPYSPTPKPLVVRYVKAVGKLSGMLMDIDGVESWKLEAFDKDDAKVGETTVTVSSPSGAQQDGIATFFKLDRGDKKDIVKLRLSGSSGGAAFGFGFDNFTPSGICPPE